MARLRAPGGRQSSRADHPRRSWSSTDVRGTAPQFCGPKFIDTGAMAVPIAGVRFGRSTTRGRGDRRPPPREDPAQARRALAGGFDNRTTGSSSDRGALFSRGCLPSPSTLCFLGRKIAARLFRRCQRPVEARIMPDSFVPSNGFCLYGDRITTNCGPRW